MRLRPLTVVLALVLVMVVGYALWWQKVGKNAIRAIDAQVAEQRRAGAVIDYQGPYLAGFPLRVAVLMRAVHAHDPQGRDLTAQEVEASAPVWSLPDVLLTIHQPVLGVTIRAGTLTLEAQEARAKATLDPTQHNAASHAEMGLMRPRLTVNGLPITAKTLQITVDRPLPPPADHLGTGLALTLNAGDITVPEVKGLGSAISHLGLSARLMGPVPATLDAAAVGPWSREGGTLEVDRLNLRWGGMDLTANATVTLDNALQPLMAGTADVTGYDALIDSLVSDGRMRSDDANIAKMALSLMAQPGVGGQMTMKVPVSVENHLLTLGPLPVGRLPEIEWK